MNAEQNIKKYFAFRFFSRFYFYFAILTMFFMNQGLTLMTTGLTIAIYSMTVVIFTMLASNLSDKYGRKQFLVIGEVFKALGCLFLGTGNKIFMFVIGEFLCGLGFAIVAGTDSAFLYENYISINRENDYKASESKSHSILFFAALIAGIIGSIVYGINARLPFLLTIPFNIIAALIALSFKPIPKKTNNEKKSNAKLRIGMYLRGEIPFYLLLYALIRGMIMTVFIGLVPFYLFLVLDIKIEAFGLYFAVYMLIGHFSGRFVNVIEKRCGKTGISLIMSIAIGVSLIFFAILDNKIGIIIPAILYFVAGCIRPFAMSNINSLIIDGNHRGSILALSEFLYGIFNVTFLIISFGVYSYYSLQTAFWTLFVVYLTLFTVLFIYRFIISKKG